MAWGDGIKPEDKIYKSQGNDIDLGTLVMLMFLFVIAISIAYLAFSKYRERVEIEEAAKYAQNALIEWNRQMSESMAQENRRVEKFKNRFIPPKPLSEIKVPYPELSKINNEHGTVLVEVTISRYGRPERVKLAKTSGYERLDTAALKTIENTIFEPAQKGYDQVPFTYVIDINF
ncbi:energy transducer TonB [Neisseria zalophi]|uniref:Energy transducer TonB n=1 Tax=Neisseria zalophi TaxID=640030 RepID=A0A5J6PUF5_9NEIS|nr:energy transducer TonB [Neisseria zalophi]QEY26289.1 energy transducer TonB [Neisseria zalophi]